MSCPAGQFMPDSSDCHKSSMDGVTMLNGFPWTILLQWQVQPELCGMIFGEKKSQISEFHFIMGVMTGLCVRFLWSAFGLRVNDEVKTRAKWVFLRNYSPEPEGDSQTIPTQLSHYPHIQAWLIHFIHYTVWCEIWYPFPNSNGATIEVWK